MIDICCNVNIINTKEGDNLKITMQIKLQPTKEEIALLDFTMQEYHTHRDRLGAVNIFTA